MIVTNEKPESFVQSYQSYTRASGPFCFEPRRVGSKIPGYIYPLHQAQPLLDLAQAKRTNSNKVGTCKMASFTRPIPNRRPPCVPNGGFRPVTEQLFRLGRDAAPDHWGQIIRLRLI